MDPETYKRLRKLEALLRGGDHPKARALAETLVIDAMRERRSGGPRGSLERTALALLDEGLLVELVARISVDQRLAPTLGLVAEWGGWRSADAIAARLEDRRFDDAVVREHAIDALRVLGGDQAVRAVAKIACRREDPLSPRALDALEALAWARVPEVAQGGAAPISLTAEKLWTDHRATLEHTAIGQVIAQLARASTTRHDHVDLVRAALLTAMEARFRELLSATKRPSVRRRTVDDARGIAVAAELT